MERGRPGKSSKIALATAIALLCAEAVAVPSPDPSPLYIWSDTRLDAVVRIEVAASPTEEREVGTGFIVEGKDGAFVLTSTHVIEGLGASSEPTSECAALPSSIDLYRRSRQGEHLSHKNCAWRLGSDISLLPLLERPQQYPHLTLAARRFYETDMVYPAGFPNKFGLDRIRAGRVSSPDENGLVVTDALLAGGMSGAPYLSTGGFVVGVHTGGIKYTSGFSIFTPVARIKNILEPYLGPIVTEEAAPPDINEAMASYGNNAKLSDLLALRLIPDVAKRISTWIQFTGRPATPNEVELVKNLPTLPQPAALPSGALPEPSLDPGIKDRLSLAKELTAANRFLQSSCKPSSIGIEDDLLKCGTTPQYFPSSNLGRKLNPRLIVLHTTGISSLQASIHVLTDSSRTASAHLLIDRDGTFVQLVPFNLQAAHAGVSRWKGLTNLNSASIGIELINAGRLTRDEAGHFRTIYGEAVEPGNVKTVTDANGTSYWHQFSAEQLATLEAISKMLAWEYAIKEIVGHCSIDPGRKTDPGPALPIADLNFDIFGKKGIDCP